MVEKEYIINILNKLINPPISLYSVSVKQSKSNLLIEVELDHLENIYGSVTVGDCEDISRQLRDELELEKPDLVYTLNVSSAGAERELKIPNDVLRFKDLPLRLSFFDSDGKEWNHVVVVKSCEGENLQLESFKSKKKKEKLYNFSINLKDIKKGNLYLEY